MRLFKLDDNVLMYFQLVPLAKLGLLFVRVELLLLTRLALVAALTRMRGLRSM